MLKEAVFTVKLEADLRDAFIAEAERTPSACLPASAQVHAQNSSSASARRTQYRWFRVRAKDALR
jgi:hypothetical protein